MEKLCTPLTPPLIDPRLPTYPVHMQNVRVYGAPLTGLGGPVVYSGFIQQYNAALAMRDREACYVIEPNQALLFPGIVLARLIGSYAGLPLLDV